jgi:DNA-directed RNA polymerase subunit RPC12/RpoP
MPVIVFRFQDFQSDQEERPDHCPYCGGQVLQRWGKGVKIIQDIHQEVGHFHRYACQTCGRTFRIYPAGIDRSRLTRRVRKVSGIAWALGLSAQEVVNLFETMGVELNYMGVWREGHDLVMHHPAAFGPGQPGRFSIDKLFLKNKGRGIGTSFMVDLGGGKTVALGRMDEVDYRKLLAWIEPIIKDMDIQVAVVGTDVLFDLASS